MRQFLQTLYLCGLACSSYGLPRCGIRSLQSQKRKRGKKLSTVDLNAYKNSSWDLFPAGPTGASTRWVRWDRRSDAQEKNSNSASLFPASCSSQDFSCQSSCGGHAFFWQNEHHRAPLACTHKAGSLTITIQKNSVKWLEVGAAFNEKKIDFLYIF